MTNTNPVAPALSMTESLQRSWRSVIANIWLFAGFTILYYIATWVAGHIPVLGMATNLFSFVYTVSIFSGLQAASKSGTISFNDFFTWTPKFGKLFVAHLALIGIAIVIFLPLIILMIYTVGYGFLSEFSYNSYTYVGGSSSLFSSGTALVMMLLFFVLGLLFLMLAFSYTYLVQFRDMTPGQAFKESWSIGKNNIGALIIFVLISIGIMLLGVLALVIGVLVAVPVILGMQYYFLRSAFPEESVQDWDFMAGRIIAGSCFNRPL